MAASCRRSRRAPMSSHLDRLIAAAMAEAASTYGDLDGIAATAGPGLIGGLMVGLTTAKAIALATAKPLLAINHLEAHALTPRLLGSPRLPLSPAPGLRRPYPVPDRRRRRALSPHRHDHRRCPGRGLRQDGEASGPCPIRAARKSRSAPATAIPSASPSRARSRAATTATSPSRASRPRCARRSRPCQVSTEHRHCRYLRELRARHCRDHARAVSACAMRRFREVHPGHAPSRRSSWRAASPPTRRLDRPLERHFAPSMASRSSCRRRASVHRQCRDDRLGRRRAPGARTDRSDLDAPARPRWPLDPSAEPAPGAGRQGMRRRIAIAGAGAWGRALAFVVDARPATMVRRLDRAATMPDRSRRTATPLILAIPGRKPAAKSLTLPRACAISDPRLHPSSSPPRASSAEPASSCNDVVAATIARGARLRPVRPELRRRCRARPADRRDARPRQRMMKRRQTGPQRSASPSSASMPPMISRASRSAGRSKTCSPSPAASPTASGLGDSARAALTTRGFAELTRFGRKLGARARNPDRSLRPRRSPAHLLEPAIAQFLLRHARSAKADRSRKRLPMPRASSKARTPRPLPRRSRANTISTCRSSMAVHAIIDAGVNPDDEIARLLARPVRAEIRD